MLKLLKIGGLGFSALLTFSFFTRLFGLAPFGFLVASAALILYEGGAWGWAEMLKKARHGQIATAKICLSVTVFLSVLSSSAEIVLATKLASKALGNLDLEFISLFGAALALATNIIGVFVYEAETPETKAKARRLGQQARLAELKDKQQDAALDAAEAESLVLIDSQAPQFGMMLAQSAIGETQREMERLARQGEVIDNPPQRPQLNNGAGGYSYNFQATAAPMPNTRPTPQYAPSGPSTPHSAAYDDDSRYFDDTAQPTQHAAPAAQPTTPAEERETAEDANANTPKAAARPQRKKQGA